MQARKRSRNLLFVLFFLLCGLHSRAQNLSYVYIQGDKITPFYVKLEGEMLPRYSKNYYIIPQLASGPIHIQILYQQNEFPAQNYVIQVPENGFRGFMLTRKANEFALYDIVQRFYLLPGDAGEDHLPEMNTVTNFKPIREPVEEPFVAAETETPGKPKKGKPKPAFNKKQEPALTDPANNRTPAFINNIELSNEHAVEESQVKTDTESIPNSDAQAAEPNQELIDKSTQQADSPAIAEESQQPADNNIPKAESPAAIDENQLAVDNTTPQTDNPPADQSQQSGGQNQSPEETQQQSGSDPDPIPVSQMQLKANAPAIPNSDCPEPMGEAKFDDIFTRTDQKDSDEKRITYLMKRIEGNCFSTRQAALLARKLTAESLRYSFFKKIYPRITDQQNFPLLDQLFKTTEWKSYFQLIQ